MCGRYVVKTKVSELAPMFEALVAPSLTPSYNVAPTHVVPVVRMVPVVRLKPSTNEREMVMLRWGLIPHWAKDGSGNLMINARADTVADKPAFRDAFRRRRCLIVADGFYEWQRTSGKKQTYFIGMRDESPFAFAGLWESWGDDPFGEPIESCAIITTDANEILRPIHNRMPVILQPKDYAKWLDPEIQDAAELQDLLVPFPAEKMRTYPVSTLVNKVDNNSPECFAPVTLERAPEPPKELFD